LIPSRLHALIPAAGRGARYGGDLPKQYLALGGATMLEHAIASLLADARIDRVVVVVAPDDARIDALRLDARVLIARVGGASRAASVRAGLDALHDFAASDDWVLVHDAARPCLSPHDLATLIDRVAADAVGGLLAQPLADTLKRGDGGRVAATLDRSSLWRAATPQMFRIGLLRRALDAPGMLESATDEASAVEQLGLAPLLVGCQATNLKVTTADDLPLACAILGLQGRL
jgi:2-C-methyl-D-erythritol 4-phosphate cytidylyltransferase